MTAIDVDGGTLSRSQRPISTRWLTASRSSGSAVSSLDACSARPNNAATAATHAPSTSHRLRPAASADTIAAPDAAIAASSSGRIGARKRYRASESPPM